MTAANVEAIYRLSPVQEGMLYHCLAGGAHERGGGDGTYLVQYSCLYDDVDVECLERAWREVVQRHTALRTLFTWERRSQPLQIVRRHVELAIEQQDWRGLDAAEQQRRWQSHTQRDRDHGFDLERAPLMRLGLMRLDEHCHRFLWSFHHLLLDGWSMRLALGEALDLYSTLRAGNGIEPAPARPFGDFIAWLDQRDGSGDEAFWREYLRGFHTPTKLDPPREQVVTARSDGVGKRTLDAACLDGLTRQARAARLTVNNLVLGAWALLLSRHADTDDIVFGTTVSGRPAELQGVERIAGLFINTLPLRVCVRPDARLVDWLAEVQTQQRKTLAHEHTPLVEIKRCSEVPPDAPLFESIVGYKNIPVDEAGARGEHGLVGRDENYVEYSNYPLALLAVPDTTLALYLVNDPARFSAAVVERLLEQVASILEAMSRSLDCAVHELPVLPATELAQVLPPPSVSAVDFDAARCIHEIIEEQARRTPRATAVIDPDGTLDYATLSASTGRLSGRLATRGVTRGTPVPVITGRNRDAIIAMLAVLQAGGTYVPIDPDWPAERIALMLANLHRVSPLAAVLCDGDALALLGEHATLGIVVEASIDEAAAKAGDASTAGDPDDLAYIIHTSGSTGQPRGVMVSHANLFNSVRARDVFYPHAPAVFLLLSPLATDSSIAGLFWTLCSGGALLLPPYRVEQDPQALADLVARHGVSHTLCLPSLYHALLEHGDSTRLASLDTVIVAGEACTAGVVRAHHRLLPATRLYNEYGPSEATVWATATELHAADADGPVPIGRPIANTTAYVLDAALRPAPLGVAGELCIGGANVARGYHGQPERTAERFVDDPFSDTTGARLYRTGDRVRRHADGRIEFLGRIDNQVKIRGYRVEPEEIETVLNTHHDVVESAVGIASSTKSTDHDVEPQRLLQALQQLDAEEAQRLLAEVESLSPGDVEAQLARYRRATGDLPQEASS